MRKVNGAAGPRSAVRRVSVFLVIVLAAGLLSVPSQAIGVGQVLAGQQGLGDLDARTGSVAPTASQAATAAALGATVTWNRFGTPHSLIKYGGYLATGLSGDTAGVAARSWLDSQKDLFRLTSVTNSSLELISDNQLPDSNGHAVLFRQRFGALPAVQDGMITLGVVGTSTSGWKLAYVSSTSAGTQAAPADTAVSPTAAWLAAAQNAGQPSVAAAISKIHTEDGWTAFTVNGYAQLQRARLRALPIPGAGVRPVYEVDVLNAMGGQSIAYVSLVDAVSKKVWFRQNRVDDAAADSARPDYSAGEANDAPATGTFSGTTGPAGACGPQHLISAPSGTQSIDVIASSTIPANDIVLKLVYKVTNATVGSSDEATSPEAIHYAPAGGVPAGNYGAQVCPFTAGAAPFDYSGQFITQDTASGGVPYPPEWKLFTAYPSLNYGNADSRIVACWEKTIAAADCNLPVKNLASRSPWDFIVGANSPSFTSIGNNAKTAEAWLSPLTPGENYSPPAADRRYYFPWTNQWYTSKCDPTNFASAARNDIDASIINLFVGHNRFHDFSYFLGFTEQTWNLQQDNFGNGQPGPFPGNEGDPELGNVQAGAVTGGAPSYEGRDNANQITLQDGIAPITNQYLFQPIAAASTAPASTAASTPRSSATSTRTPSPTGWSADPTRA
jgi:extracellular elastinolytic metalloproteinase